MQQLFGNTDLAKEAVTELDEHSGNYTPEYVLSVLETQKRDYGEAAFNAAVSARTVSAKCNRIFLQALDLLKAMKPPLTEENGI